uniref:olfactory receptor 6N1-like n=1 Tax=Scatophagus argus TaxID=75038 RepID=UPI001ED7D3CC|nr:olfactory receptor 6N1-like [Scatophagus argus]
MDDVSNVSTVTVFTLSAFSEALNHRAAVFSLTLLCYCVIVVVNVSLVIIIVVDENLHEPMYVLLCVCCINGLYGTAGFYPKFLVDLLSPSQVISYGGCLCQAFVLYSFVCSGTSVLAAMAYDRHVAICRPLQYRSVMTKRRLAELVVFSWLTPFCIFSINILLTNRLTFCSANIQRLFCVNWIIVGLACPNMDTLINNAFAFTTLSIYICHWLFIVWTYADLVRTCLKSREDRAKFMQTCLPNLISLLTLFVTVVSDLMHMRFASKDLPQSFQNFVAMAVLLIPPIMDPLLYGFRLTKIRSRILVLVHVRQK